MEDHYVRAHTRLGSALILIPLRQAVEELGGLPGLRIHRSWWVARHAVVGSMQDGRNVRLRLANGLFAPVSRGSVAAARAFGLLTPAETYESADATLN
jgi:DNA-binding LytR/AlgR family response regulator